MVIKKEIVLYNQKLILNYYYLNSLYFICFQKKLFINHHEKLFKTFNIKDSKIKDISEKYN